MATCALLMLLLLPWTEGSNHEKATTLNPPSNLKWNHQMTRKYFRQHERTEIKMPCNAYGEPLPDTKWLKDGRPFDAAKRGNDRTTQKRRFLRLSDIDLRDAGIYTCIASNRNGNKIEWIYTILVVRNTARMKPRIVTKTTNYTAYEGENVTLECRVMSTYVPMIQWVKHYQVNGSWTGPNNTQYLKMVQISGPGVMKPQYLTLTNVTKDDATKYSCLAFDQKGYEHYIYHWLTVKPAPTTPPPIVVEVSRPPLMIILGSVAAATTLLIIVIVFTIRLCYRRDYNTANKGTIDMMVENLLENDLYRRLPNGGIQIEFDAHWELPRDGISLGCKIGEGAFGRVMKACSTGLLGGTAHPCTVAVKMLKEDATEQELIDLIQEMDTMKNIGRHMNLINFLGCCAQDGPLWVVVEFAPHGNLRDFLREHRHLALRASTNSSSGGGKQQDLTLAASQLLSFARQCAKGMDYLAAQRIIHRDLAARNVLVAEDYVLKLADYGLARNISDSDYYRKTTDGRLPVKWMAPEALFDRRYTTASDVWSFGVLLWEIYSMGSNPYPSVPLENLLQLLKEGYRMEKPLYANFEMYSMMLQCWKYCSDDRPTFAELISTLDTLLTNTVSTSYLSLEPADELDDDVFASDPCVLRSIPANPRRSDSQYSSMSSGGDTSPEPRHFALPPIDQNVRLGAVSPISVKLHYAEIRLRDEEVSDDNSDSDADCKSESDVPDKNNNAASTDGDEGSLAHLMAGGHIVMYNTDKVACLVHEVL